MSELTARIVDAGIEVPIGRTVTISRETQHFDISLPVDGALSQYLIGTMDAPEAVEAICQASTYTILMRMWVVEWSQDSMNHFRIGYAASLRAANGGEQ